jgi:chromosome segregation ATPase
MWDLKGELDSPNDLVIDLRDPKVADGLAEMLGEVAVLGERVGAAEAKAEVAFHDRLAATGRLRMVSDDLENERAERQRLELDNATVRTENDVRLEQLAQLEATLAETRDDLRRNREATDELRDATDDLIEWLQSELARTKRSNHLLEALLSKRRRKDFERLVRQQAGPLAGDGPTAPDA